MATSGYYNGTLLSKLLATCKKHSLLGSKRRTGVLSTLVATVQTAKLGAADLDKVLNDAPGEFLDLITSEIMDDPVYLGTTSKQHCNRSTIAQHLLNDSTDPFSRQPLVLEDVQEAPELKVRIEAWIEEKKREAGMEA